MLICHFQIHTYDPIQICLRMELTLREECWLKHRVKLINTIVNIIALFISR